MRAQRVDRRVSGLLLLLLLLLATAVVVVQRRRPRWTDHDVSDPGITL